MTPDAAPLPQTEPWEPEPEPSGYGVGRKLGGILAEQSGGEEPYVVVGIGINVSLSAEELPAPHATSLALAGAYRVCRVAIEVSLRPKVQQPYGRPPLRLAAVFFLGRP